MTVHNAEGDFVVAGTVPSGNIWRSSTFSHGSDIHTSTTSISGITLLFDSPRHKWKIGGDTVPLGQVRGTEHLGGQTSAISCAI